MSSLGSKDVSKAEEREYDKSREDGEVFPSLQRLDFDFLNWRRIDPYHRLMFDDLSLDNWTERSASYAEFV